MENYYVVNLETGKLELHFEKETYQALTEDQKKEIKSNFLWGRNSGCWISRAKEPNLSWARRVAVSLGLEDAGKEGERLSFAEQMERKAERAERRADRYENRAYAAERKGEALQAPINEMHGDIALERNVFEEFRFELLLFVGVVVFFLVGLRFFFLVF